MTVTPASYATPADLQMTGLPVAYFTGDLSPTTDQQQTFLNQAAALMDSYIAANPDLSLPLAPPFDPMLVKCNVDMAVFEMAVQRGYNPESPDKGLQIRHDAALKWVKDLGSARAKLQRQVVAPNPLGKQPFMISACSRGLRNWGGNIGGSGGM